MPPIIQPSIQPPGISPYLSTLTTTGPVHTMPTPTQCTDNILGECPTQNSNCIESLLRERLHAKMASRRAEKQRCSQLDSSQTKFKVADAFELTKSVSVDEDPIHLWDASHKTPVEGTPQLNEMITFGPLYADSLCTQWSDDAIASTRNPLDADSLCTKWPNDATVASQTVPILNPLSTDSLCTKWPVDAPVDSQSSTLPDLASQYTVVSAWPDDLVERVHAVVNHSTCVRPTAPEFQFELSCDAADHNAKALERYGFNLGAAIEANSSSPLGYGSEFRPVHILAPIFERHPNWNRLRVMSTLNFRL